MVTKLSGSYCGIPLVESYCKDLNIPDTNWLRYLSSSNLIKNFVGFMTSPLGKFTYFINLSISGTKKIFETSKGHSHKDLDREDANFIILS